MKRLLICACLFLGGTIGSDVAHAAKRVSAAEYESRVSFQSESKEDIVIRSLGFGSNDTKAADDAELRAVKHVFFVGFSDARKYDRLIDDESKVLSEHESFFANFFDNRQYKRYVSGTVCVGELKRQKGQKEKSAPYDITVNYKGLRRELESKKIIRGLGF